MDEGWEGSEALGLGPWYYRGLLEELSGDRETWLLSACGRRGGVFVCFFPEEPWEGKRESV